MSIDSEPVRWVLLGLLNIPIYLGLGRFFFDDWSGFWSCVGFWFTPDWISLLRGEYFDDHWSELKLFVFVAICFAAVYGEYRFFFGDPFKSKEQPSGLTLSSTCPPPWHALRSLSSSGLPGSA